MNDAAQIRRCGGALRANHPLLPAPDPKNSNREALRLETDVTPTKKTAAQGSNREESPALQITINPPTSTTCDRCQLHSKIPNFQPSKKAKSPKNDPQSLF